MISGWIFVYVILDARIICCQNDIRGDWNVNSGEEIPGLTLFKR